MGSGLRPLDLSHPLCRHLCNCGVLFSHDFFLYVSYAVVLHSTRLMMLTCLQHISSVYVPCCLLRTLYSNFNHQLLFSMNSQVLRPLYIMAKVCDHEIVKALETHLKAVPWTIEFTFLCGRSV